MQGDICHIEHCENPVSPDRWLQYEYYCERPLPEEQTRGVETVVLRFQVCERHYRLLYVQPSHWPNAMMGFPD